MVGVIRVLQVTVPIAEVEVQNRKEPVIAEAGFKARGPFAGVVQKRGVYAQQAYLVVGLQSHTQVGRRRSEAPGVNIEEVRCRFVVAYGVWNCRNRGAEVTRVFLIPQAGRTWYPIDLFPRLRKERQL